MLYHGITVEHSYNCMVLLCRLFLGLSGHYTKSAGHPDYANAVSIFKSSVVSNTSYTVPFDGILTLVASSISSAGSVSASVNGVTIANWRDNGASSSSSSTGANVFTVPVKNGDIVVLGASNNAFFTTSSRLVPYS